MSRFVNDSSRRFEDSVLPSSSRSSSPRRDHAGEDSKVLQDVGNYLPDKLFYLPTDARITLKEY